MRKVSVLFAMEDSYYKQMDDVEVYDIDRDALSYVDGTPIVAHPPCRLWGQLSHFSTAPIEEKQLAVWSIEKIRKNGGVLEHPANSRLWSYMGLPHPNKGYDKYGGYSLGLLQWWFGHKADKATRLYICGVAPNCTPEIPFKLGYPSFVVSSSKRKHSNSLPWITKKERKKTPPNFCEWLVELARRTKIC